MKTGEDIKVFEYVSELVGGNAVICNNKGDVIIANKDFSEEKLLAPAMICLRSAIENKKSISLRTDEDIMTAVILLGDNKWLVIDNSKTVCLGKKQKQIMIDALPYIAQISGGDATLFNKEGIRENAFSPDGSRNVAVIGEYKELYTRTLLEMRPSMGPAFFSGEATAVRIPITKDFGLAFNNKLSVSRQKKLLKESRRNKSARYQLEDIIGVSTVINDAKNLARTAARTNSTVLLYGDTGTGKELFAQAIHNASIRSSNPFVALNCGAIPENLVESILFGYTEGAFTGAKKSGSIGAFEQANKGTLFLDEISEMPYDLQVRLLRAIQEREIMKIGDVVPTKIDVRIIAATNNNIKEMVEDGRFRADLYFRLNVLTVNIPSLRERPEDINILFDYFLHNFSKVMSKISFDLEIEPDVFSILHRYTWPGNVRELQNCAEYVVNVLEQGEYAISSKHIPYYILEAAAESDVISYSSYDDYMYKHENNFLKKAFEMSGGNKSKMARQIGVNRTTLLRMLKKHNIDI